jgi:acyl carrier protein
VTRVRVLVAIGPGARSALGLLGPPADRYAFPHPRVSLSHTTATAAAAVAIGPAAGIGVDVERPRPADPRTARFFLRPREQAWLGRHPDRAVEHLRLWTVKEALFKADLANADRTLRDFATDDPAARTGLAAGPDGGRFVYTTVRRADLILSVATAVHTRHSGVDMPMPTITFDTVAARVAALLRRPVDDLTPRTRLADLAPDSFTLVEVVIDLQEEFGVTFTQAELRPVVTLGDLVDLLRGRHDAG